MTTPKKCDEGHAAIPSLPHCISLEHDPAVPGNPGNQLARVATVGPDQRDRRHRHPRAVEDAAPAVAVLQAGRGHQHDDEQAQRVDDDVSLAPVISS